MIFLGCRYLLEPNQVLLRVHEFARHNTTWDLRAFDV